MTPLEGWLFQFYRLVSQHGKESLPQWATEHLNEAPAVTVNKGGELTSFGDPDLAAVVEVDRRAAAAH